MAAGTENAVPIIKVRKAKYFIGRPIKLQRNYLVKLVARIAHSRLATIFVFP